MFEKIQYEKTLNCVKSENLVFNKRLQQFKNLKKENEKFES